MTVVSIVRPDPVYDPFMKNLDRANPDKLQGSWKENFLRSIEEVEEARRVGAK
ncbi:MAG: hypothetical protein ACI9DF_005777 [Verrucomicrobiales bacterium]|jgi:hypothetical protein